MKERPILFSPPLVRKLLAGEKTQTRRLRSLGDVSIECADGKREQPTLWRTDGHGTWIPYCRLKTTGGLGIPGEPITCPFGVEGDRLWVREMFSYSWGCTVADVGAPVWFWADGQVDHGDWTRPKPSIHLPRWASRITLEITGVRVERLQSITEDDAKAEGMVLGPSC